MSFDIHYRTCNLGTRTVERENPFTGDMQTVPVDHGMSTTGRAAVRKLLASAGASKPDKYGRYTVKFSDGGTAEVFADELEGPEQCDGLMVSLRGMTEQTVGFLWELCREGNMAAIPVMEEDILVVVSEKQRQRVQGRWPDAVAVGSPKELDRLLKGGLAAWQAYRKQVAGD